MTNIIELKDAISIITSVALVLIGISGLETWKRQLRGNVEYDQSRKLLRAVYKVRDAIRIVRNPFMGTAEHITALERAGISTKEINSFDDKLRDKAFRLAYQGRLEKLSEAVSELNLVAFEAEVLWGESFLKVVNPFRICVSDLFWAVETHFQLKDRKRNPNLFDQVEEIFWGHDNLVTSENVEIKNKYSARVIETIKGIEEFIHPHIKLK